jgi:hypothetical protein
MLHTLSNVYNNLGIVYSYLGTFDPLIDNLSQGEVAMKVLFNSGLAFAVFTAHHFLEGRMNSMIRKK